MTVKRAAEVTMITSTFLVIFFVLGIVWGAGMKVVDKFLG